MMWNVRYGVYYKDGVRHGLSNGWNRSNSFAWIAAAKKDMDCLYVRVYHGPVLLREWIRDCR